MFGGCGFEERSSRGDRSPGSTRAARCPIPRCRGRRGREPIFRPSWTRSASPPPGRSKTVRLGAENGRCRGTAQERSARSVFGARTAGRRSPPVLGREVNVELVRWRSGPVYVRNVPVVVGRVSSSAFRPRHESQGCPSWRSSAGAERLGWHGVGVVRHGRSHATSIRSNCGAVGVVRHGRNPRAVARVSRGSRRGARTGARMNSCGRNRSVRSTRRAWLGLALALSLVACARERLRITGSPASGSTAGTGGGTTTRTPTAAAGQGGGQDGRAGRPAASGIASEPEATGRDGSGAGRSERRRRGRRPD